mgnify:FL=1|jgi:hypothetical protein
MDGIVVMGLIFGMVGVVPLVRLEKLTKTLKEKGILGDDCKEAQFTVFKILSHSRITTSRKY